MPVALLNQAEVNPKKILLRSRFIGEELNIPEAIFSYAKIEIVKNEAKALEINFNLNFNDGSSYLISTLKLVKNEILIFIDGPSSEECSHNLTNHTTKYWPEFGDGPAFEKETSVKFISDYLGNLSKVVQDSVLNPIKMFNYLESQEYKIIVNSFGNWIRDCMSNLDSDLEQISLLSDEQSRMKKLKLLVFENKAKAFSGLYQELKDNFNTTDKVLLDYLKYDVEARINRRQVI